VPAAAAAGDAAGGARAADSNVIDGQYIVVYGFLHDPAHTPTVGRYYGYLTRAPNPIP